MCVYTPLADFNSDQMEERNRTGQSMLLMFVRDLYVYVGACELLFSTCADLCVHTCMCMCIMNSALFLGAGSQGSPTAIGLVDGATIVLLEPSSAEAQSVPCEFLDI